MFFVVSDTLTFVREINETQDETMLRTGEAAELLGCSRQHVVDLCERGVLPSTRVGSHRRVRLGDVMQVATGASPGALRPDQERNLWLHTGVAGELVADPAGTLRKARENLDRLVGEHPRGQARRRLDDWRRILNGSIAGIVEVLISPSERSIELRQNSPFAGVLETERRRAILSAYRSDRSGDAS